MTITTMSSREFNQDASRAKKAASKGPVFITDRGKPAHVLMTVEAYRQLVGSQRKIADILAMPGSEDSSAEDIDFDPQRIDIESRPADFS